MLLHMNSQNRPLVSIITVCFNCKSDLTRTIESIESQLSKDFEHIVVDGASQDGTLSILEQRQKQYQDAAFPFKFIHEKDFGPYDAMNKGIQIAEGIWTIFLNAGDTFVDSEVLQKASSFLSVAKNDVVYGSTVVHWNNGKTMLMKPLPMDTIYYKMPFCHQSVFTRTALLKERSFSRNYSIVADFDMFFDFYHGKKSFMKIDVPIANFYYGGLSAQPIKILQQTRQFLGTYEIPLSRRIHFYIHAFNVRLRLNLAKLPILQSVYRKIKYRNRN